MSTKELETAGRVTASISSNKLDRGFCTQKINIVDNRKLVM